MSNLLRQPIHATHRLATSLRPPLLDDLGLGPVSEWQARNFQEWTGVLCMLAIDANIVGGPIPSELVTAFFRMTQELFTSILRHAQASQIEISLRMKDELLLLELQADGIRFIECPSSTASFRLFGIQERTKAVAGHSAFGGSQEVASTRSFKCLQMLHLFL